jgi:hypothetical protein
MWGPTCKEPGRNGRQVSKTVSSVLSNSAVKISSADQGWAQAAGRGRHARRAKQI